MTSIGAITRRWETPSPHPLTITRTKGGLGQHYEAFTKDGATPGDPVARLTANMTADNEGIHLYSFRTGNTEQHHTPDERSLYAYATAALLHACIEAEYAPPEGNISMHGLVAEHQHPADIALLEEYGFGYEPAGMTPDSRLFLARLAVVKSRIAGIHPELAALTGELQRG